MKVLGLIALALLAGAGWVRGAPSDPVRWHRMPEPLPEAKGPGHVVERLPGRAAEMAELDRLIRDTPRTQVLAGSVAEGMVTYVTRSKWMGFPDYTTVARRGDDLVIFARLRFGKSDFGVNAARVGQWRERLGQGG
ncbi:DUF1499 domain-containing protein [Roseovarius sp. C7]|uniref:DUF1499 domain-containing protein n=1 Tax=Roseovarius sp. C7 TaxID=3398643 RepID=UPI0039F593AB